uniref:C-X-C chemokine receptor type 4-like n=1 Tax=Mastacembelus armatus TaxID=205130 RepID=A0A3Q3MBP0_9TELE
YTHTHTHTHMNKRSAEQPSPVSWEPSSLVTAVVLCFCVLLGVPGNIAVIILRSHWQHLSSLSQSLMLNLTVSDLLCLITLPLWIYSFLYNWIFGVLTCKLLAYLVYFSLYSSLLTVTMLSIQRYLLVVYLQRYLDHIGKWRVLVLLWLIAMSLSIPALVHEQLTTEQNRTQCHKKYSSDTQQVAVLLTEFLIGCVSCFVVAFAYISLYRKVNQVAFFNNPLTTKLVTSLIVTFFVLWIPYHTINVICVSAILLKNNHMLKICRDSSNIAAALIFVNSCLNPLLYAFASVKKNLPLQNTCQI